MTGRLTDYWVTVFRRTWKGSIVTSFLMPFLYLSAMGVGLGGFVDANAPSRALGGASYLAFIAPGLLATTAMQTAVAESTYPVMGGFKWHKSYFSMAASPLGVSDIVAAQLGFILFRIGVTCLVFTVVIGLYGALATWWGAVAAFVVVLLVGLAHAAPVCGLTARMRSENGFSLIFRLGLIPMFLFSGAFFPVSQLPAPVSWLAYATPIWHGVDLTRMLTSGQVHGWAALGHVAYIVAWVVGGWFFAVRGFAGRLAR